MSYTHHTGLYGFDIANQKLACMAAYHLWHPSKGVPLMVYRGMHQDDEGNWIGRYQCPVCGHETLVARNYVGLVRARKW